MDRQDGTGRGRRGDRKGGNTRGGWGGQERPLLAEGEAAVIGDGATVDGAPVEEEKRAPRERRERVQPAPVEPEEEVGYTLDDYFADKQAKSKGLLAATSELRAKEKIQDKVQVKEGEKSR